MRFIDAEKLEKKCECLILDAKSNRDKYDPIKDRQQWATWTSILADRYAFLVDILMDRPVFDDIPVNKGRWKRMNDRAVQCSVCGYIWIEFIVSPHIKYCPHCGAEMEGIDEG